MISSPVLLLVPSLSPPLCLPYGSPLGPLLSMAAVHFPDTAFLGLLLLWPPLLLWRLPSVRPSMVPVHSPDTAFLGLRLLWVPFSTPMASPLCPSLYFGSGTLPRHGPLAPSTPMALLLYSYGFSPPSVPVYGPGTLPRHGPPAPSTPMAPLLNSSGFSPLSAPLSVVSVHSP